MEIDKDMLAIVVCTKYELWISLTVKCKLRRHLVTRIKEW